MNSIEIPVAPAKIATSFLEGKSIAQEFGFPLVIRPSFTLGGTGAAFVFHKDDFEPALNKGLHASPIHEVLINKAVVGWKEYELELLRDDNDNVIIICNIENLDPMGIHTGDSITIAPSMTLSDSAYQRMRTMAIISSFSSGLTANCTLHPPANSPIERIILIAIVLIL
jgi:carbamoyl-phosphate synthase large subunit